MKSRIERKLFHTVAMVLFAVADKDHGDSSHNQEDRANDDTYDGSLRETFLVGGTFLVISRVGDVEGI